MSPKAIIALVVLGVMLIGLTIVNLRKHKNDR